MARLTVDRLSKSFGDNKVLKDVSMDVADGEFIAVLGPSGCGKTTLLRLVAGFEAIGGGSISIGARIVSGPGVHLPPEQRRMGIVFQSYALWPHMTVAENVGYALKVQGVPAEQTTKRVAAALETVGIAAFAARNPASLSGGQRQRVALARCLAMEPDMVVLDEPLANLDVHLRGALAEEFAAFHKRTRTTMVYITHDQAEAMALADRIAVLDQGSLLQLATPSTLYREPASETVARFIGGGMLLPATIAGPAAAGRIAVNVLGHCAVVRCGPDAPSSGSATLCVRATDLAVEAAPTGAIETRIRRLVYQGGYFHADLQVITADRLSLAVTLPEPTTARPGDILKVALRDGWLIPGSAGRV